MYDARRVNSGQDRWVAPSVRVALAVGFTVVFGLWLGWSYQLMRSLRQTERNVANVHDSYIRGEQTLSIVRTKVLLGSIYLRDAIIDSSAERREGYRSEVARLHREVEELLRQYLPEVATGDRGHWARLQVELRDYWAARGAFADPAGSPAQTAALLEGLVPQRNSILDILDQLEALQNAALQRHQEEADLLYQQARTRLLPVGGVMLIVALLVAILVAWHVNRLQRQIERQRSAERQNREDLERLSASLVGAHETERRSLARELHDEVGQALTAVKMDIGIALRADVEPRAREALQDARDVAETTLRSVRDLSELLHPSTLDDFGLPTTLTAFLRSFSKRTGIRAQLAETIDARITPQIEVCVYRIVQEALNNVAQHSGATACTVALSEGGGVLRLGIEDNGRGLGSPAVAAAVRRSLGLIGMRERAQSLGGTFVIGDRAGGGTRIDVTLPSDAVIAPIEPTEAHPERRAG